MTCIKKAAALLLSAAMLSSLMAPCAFAESREKVGKIYLTIDTDIRIGNSGGEVEVTPTGDNTDLYYVEAVEVVNDEGDDWTRSNPPEVEITLGVEDEDAFYFSSASSSGFKLTLDSSIKSRFDKLKFVDAKRQSKNAILVLTIQLVFDSDADISSAPAPSDVKWDSTTAGKATWGDVTSAKYFQVSLYKDGNQVVPATSVYDTSYDFSAQMTEAGSYQFKVRSVKASNSGKSSWASSDTYTVNADGTTAVSGTAASDPADSTANGPGDSQPAAGGPTGTSDDGSWFRAADGQRWWWRNNDGTYPAAQWKQMGDLWYYFDAEGYMATGWLELNGVYYYLDTDNGAMYANRRTPDNYWVDASGAWVPGA
ncbi:MAG: hypothetical protein ACI4F3_01890 [Enterocloster sp.]